MNGARKRMNEVRMEWAGKEWNNFINITEGVFEDLPFD